jgi:hypothetical protein
MTLETLRLVELYCAWRFGSSLDDKTYRLGGLVSARALTARTSFFFPLRDPKSYLDLLSCARVLKIQVVSHLGRFLAHMGAPARLSTSLSRPQCLSNDTMTVWAPYTSLERPLLSPPVIFGRSLEKKNRE